MIPSVLIKDLIFGLIWFVFRALPFYLAYWLCIHLRDDTPWYVGTLLIGLSFMIPFILSTWITVAVPAIVWRYRTDHQTRLIQLDGRNYRQVKILGIWFFIQMTENGSAYYMSSNHWFSTDNLKESYHDVHKFHGRFEAFINAWKFGETAEVLRYETFEGGRLKK